MKKALVITGLILLAGYLVFAVYYFQDKPKDEICKGFEIKLSGNDAEAFVNLKDIEKFVREMGLNPKGKPLKDINTNKIEECISSNQLINYTKVYLTNGGKVIAEIEERKPVLRVISNTGENYYVDKNGRRMPLSKRFVAYLPLATGSIKREFACGDLYEFALFLSENKFWDAQIEQIVVLPNYEIELIPRVGDQIILLGKLEDFREKLDKLMTFYQKGMNETGWNKYSVINLKFEKQVVCTKR